MLELADPLGGDARVARALTKQWVGGSYGGWPEHADAEWRPEAGVTVRWHLRRGDPGGELGGAEAFELVWTRPHHRDRTLWRVVTVQIVAWGDHGRVVVIDQLDSAEPKVRESPVEGPRRSGLLAELLGAVRFVDGGWQVMPGPVEIRAERALELDAFVRGDRRLPVVLVAAGEDGRVRADTAAISDRVAGLAHVVVLCDTAAARAVAAELGVGRTAPSGGLRILWPTWRSSDPPTRHPVWHAEDVAGPDGPRAGVADALAQLVVNASTLRVERDPVVDRLGREADAAATATRRRELDAMRNAGVADRAAAEELVGEYQAELTHADERIYALEVALEREQAQRQRAEDAYLWIATAEPSGAEHRAVRTLAEAIHLAKTSMGHLVVLPEAERSAREWQYDRADLVWADLRHLDAVAAEWEAGRLRTDFATACKEHRLNWVRDVSETARQRFASDYLRSYQGQTVMLGPHLRRGGRQLLRIYCYLDAERHRVVIGHVGGHLGDTTT